MADQQQETPQNQAGSLSQQITEAIQPVMNDLREQITQTVQQQFEQSHESVGSNGAGALNLDNLGSTGETLQSTFEGVLDRLQPLFQWVLEMIQRLVNWVFSLFVGSRGEGPEETKTEGSE